MIIDSLNCVKDEDGTYSVSAHQGNKSVYENTDIADKELDYLFGSKFADVLRKQKQNANVQYNASQINNFGD